MITTDDIWSALRSVIDPDLRLPIVDLGLVYDVRIVEDSLEIDFTLTSPACPVGDVIMKDIIDTSKKAFGSEEVYVNLVWNPPWDTSRIADELKLDLGIPL